MFVAIVQIANALMNLGIDHPFFQVESAFVQSQPCRECIDSGIFSSCTPQLFLHWSYLVLQLNYSISQVGLIVDALILLRILERLESNAYKQRLPLVQYNHAFFHVVRKSIARSIDNMLPNPLLNSLPLLISSSLSAIRHPLPYLHVILQQKTSISNK